MTASTRRLLDEEGEIDIPKSSSRSLSPIVGRRRPLHTEKDDKEAKGSLLPSTRDGYLLDNQRKNGRGADGALLADLDDSAFAVFAGADDPFQHVTSEGLSRIAGRRDQEEENSYSSSSSSSSSESLAHPEDMKYSLCSNLLFLVGASIQTYLAIWDVVDATADAADSAEEDDKNAATEYLDDFLDHDVSSRVYYLLNSMGPFLFILNAIVDVKWATTLPPSRDGGLELHGHISSVFRGLPFRAVLNREEGAYTVEADVLGKLWDLASAVTFGLGASLEFYGTFFDDDDPNAVHAKGFFLTGYRVNMIAMHIYLISGLLAVHKDRSLICYPGGSIARRLIACGMMLFLMGSILDCVISYLYDPELVSNNILSELTLSWCNLSSNLLWNVDAIFYVMADCLLFSVHETKVFRPCHSVWVWIRKRMWCGRDQRGSLELPASMSVPFIVPRWVKADHNV